MVKVTSLEGIEMLTMDPIDKKLQYQCKIPVSYFFTILCITILFNPALPGQDTLPLPEFTFQGISLHPDDLLYAPTYDLVHPTIIKTEGRIENPLGKYYMYHSPHKHIAISMAYSNSIEGPWTEYPENPVITGPAAPDIRWIEEEGKFYMWGHTANKRTEMWTSGDGIQFEYHGESINANNIGTRNASYTRVYEYPLPQFGSKYIMLYSGFIEDIGIRCVWLAHSTDAENWEQLKTPLVKPVEGEFDNIYGPAFLQYNNRKFIIYQDMTTWRGGNIKYVEVDSLLNPVGYEGERFVLLDPPPGPPLNDRYRGAEFYLENDTFYMYSSASRNPRLIVYATANAIPPSSGPDTTYTDTTNTDTTSTGLWLTQYDVSIYPNPFSNVIIIDVPDLRSSVTMNLYDLNGRLQKTLVINNVHNRVRIDHVRNGIYILQLVDKNHNTIHRQKLIRQR